MTDLEAVRAIVETYRKHGWVLRRFVASPELKAELSMHFPDIPLKNAGITAAWFSRPPKPGAVSWELRFLGEPPFALLEHVDENGPELEGTLKAVEQRLMDAVTAKKQSLTSG